MSTTVALFTLSVLVVACLVLLIGMSVRLNQIANLLPGRAPAPGGSSSGGPRSRLPQVGSKLAPFATLTLDGEDLSNSDLDGRVLVGFFTTECDSCMELIPQFMTHAKALPGGRQEALAVIAGVEPEGAKLGTLLTQVARVVVEPANGVVEKAFGIDVFPAICLLDDGVVTASDFGFARIPVPLPQGRPAR